MRLIIIGGHLFIVAILTVITQVGGLIWIVSLVFSKKMNWKKRYSFPIIYLLFNLILIPIIAPFFGRVQLPVFVSNIQPQNYFYPLAFRNYVTPELRKQLIDASEDLARQGIEIDYLDANFPFWDGFPLLPHKSHNDGKKLDVAFQYIDKTTKKTTNQISRHT